MKSNQETPRLLRLAEVLDRVGYRKSSIYALAREGKFPAPVRLGARAVAWRESDIAAWIASRPRTTAPRP